MIELRIPKLRDPFLLAANGTYYVYGTGVSPDNDWNNTTYACYRAADGRLDGAWTLLDPVYVRPPHAAKNLWAPEVHRYRGAYYLFGTYFSDETQHRISAIFRADSPEGPFAEITGGALTPRDWDCIDGTLYVDSDGAPWLVFVHEWTSTDDGIGRMAAARLSDDLTHLTTAPMELFRADDPAWAHGHRVTDGCFLYTTRTGRLLMLWSNFDGDGYCVGLAASASGRIEGPWVQQEPRLYTRSMGAYDGGHGMIFADSDGTSYLCIHAPNTPTPARSEVPVLIPVREENDTLVCDPAQ